jgi:hypothetical protein
MVSERIWLVPTCTLPKLTAAGAAAKSPAGEVGSAF